MPVINIPVTPSPNGLEPFLRDFGGTMTPFLGGPDVMIVRAGTRFGARFTMPPMRDDNVRIFVSRLLQGRMNPVLMRWPLVDFKPGNPGAPLVAASVTTGTVLQLKGLTVGYTVKEGQFFSVIAGGQRYLHMATADVTASASGTATISIFPLIRRPFSVDSVVEMAQPMIEGFVSKGDELSWQIASNKFVPFNFSISERG